MLVKLIIFATAAMLAYRWLSPSRAIPEKPQPPDEEFTDYELVDDDD